MRGSILLLITFLVTVNGLGEFVARCGGNNRRAQDDPLVYPGQPGESHMHDFFGARNVNAFSTAATIRASPTSCNPPLDHSSYWTPTMIKDDVYYSPEKTTFYYHAFFRHAEVEPMPLGLSMIARKGSWSCFGSTPTTNPEDTGDDGIPNCGAGKIEMFVDYPQCWNGRDLYLDDSAHMIEAQNGACPQTHPHLLPKVQFKFVFPIGGGPGTRLSSGQGASVHGDFINGWEPAAMLNRVTECLRQDMKCPENMESDDQIVPSLTTGGDGSLTTGSVDEQPTTPPTQDPEDPEEPVPTEIPPVELPANSLQILAEADSHVRGGTGSLDNFGEAELALKKADQDLFYQREIFMRFDCTPANGRVIESAELVLTIDPGVSDIAPTIAAKLGVCTDTTWVENTMTWSNKPTCTFATNANKPANQQKMRIDVTQQVSAVVSSANKKVTFTLYIDTGAITPITYFYSREQGPNTSPQLIVTYAGDDTTETSESTETSETTEQGSESTADEPTDSANGLMFSMVVIFLIVISFML